MVKAQGPKERLYEIYLTLCQFPTLTPRIQLRMRREIYDHNVISPHEFESQVLEKAVQSQVREGLRDPLVEETAEMWERRLDVVRGQLTDFYFSRHFTRELFEQIIHEVLQERGVEPQESLFATNPELAPQELILKQALAIEQMSGVERIRLEPRLSESKVVLIRNLISDQLRYINIAKEWFTIADLAEIRRHIIYSGKIGGKAAGMLLANRILQKVGDEALREHVHVPETFYLGSDILYTYMAANDLVHWNDQKYKPEEQMHAEYPHIREDFEKGIFPLDTHERLQGLLLNVGNKPIIVRSSSLLEDNFGTSFAGKYDSFFCPNQGSLPENLKNLELAIARILSTTLNPNALLYRRAKGLQDYDERMAIMIQVVQGQKFGHYYLPDAAGVAFSRNLYRWAPQIRREDGFLRLVWGLGTRAVDRVGNDYPRLVALSHPLLHPSTSPKAIRRYSQQYVDVIDLAENHFKTLPVHTLLDSSYPPLRYIVQVDQDGYLSSMRTSIFSGDKEQMIVTYEELLRRTPFAERMRTILHTLETYYHSPVDMEFTARVIDTDPSHPDVDITILQCRPQSQLLNQIKEPIPEELPENDMVFSTNFMVPEGCVTGIQYIIFVPPEEYYALPSAEARSNLGRMIGKLNAALAGKIFICIGPGRWGTSNTDLGVYVNYGDVYNSRALVELTGAGFGVAPEPSFGTHFFQDLMEAQIFPLAIYLDDPKTEFNLKIFYESPNILEQLLPGEHIPERGLKVIDVKALRPGYRMDLVMDDDEGKAAAFFVREE
jgi:hypothetical protein